MTLIMVIPYSEGVMLISDKQSTTQSTREKVTKIDLITTNGPVIAGAGSTRDVDIIFNKIRQKDSDNRTILNDTSDIITELFGDVYLASANFNFNLIVLTNENGGVIFNQFNGCRYPQSSAINRCFYIGSGSDFVSYFLDYTDTTSFLEEETIKFGLLMIKIASYKDPFVSSPNEYGCDISICKNDGSFELKHIKPVEVNNTALLYEQGRGGINYEFE